MVVEWLKVAVPSEWRERYLRADAEVWTPVLAAQPGFLGKEVWLDAAEPDAVVLVVRWETLEQWKSIPAAVLAETDERFFAALGRRFEFLEERTLLEWKP